VKRANWILTVGLVLTSYRRYSAKPWRPRPNPDRSGHGRTEQTPTARAPRGLCTRLDRSAKGHVV